MKNWINPAIAMVSAHQESSSMQEAVSKVEEQFPEITRDVLCAFWFGVNAKNREGLDSAVLVEKLNAKASKAWEVADYHLAVRDKDHRQNVAMRTTIKNLIGDIRSEVQRGGMPRSWDDVADSLRIHLVDNPPELDTKSEWGQKLLCAAQTIVAWREIGVEKYMIENAANEVIVILNEALAADRTQKLQSDQRPEVSRLVEALELAEQWLKGWASAEAQLGLIADALAPYRN